MHEYHTKPLDRSLLLAELAAVRDALSLANIIDVSVSFGWDSNLSIDDMWKDKIVPVKDSVVEILAELAGGLRSGISYVGARSLDEFRRHAEFVRVTEAAKREPAGGAED